jgi:hypothetical protein
MEDWNVKVDITRKNGHYEGYVNGQFICSGDTAVEVAKELEEYTEKLRAGVA